MDNLFFIVFVIGFPVFWVFMLSLLSHLGGWAKLARHYPDHREAQGETYYMRSGSVGAVNYGLCLTLCVCEGGLRLSVLFPFRIGHPPLFIPWDQFHSIAERRLFVGTNVGTPVVAHVKLPIWMSDHLAAHSQPRGAR